MKLSLEVGTALLFLLTLSTAEARPPVEFKASPSAADQLISNSLKDEATYHGQNPRGIACKVVVMRTTYGHKVVIEKEADEYEAATRAVFRSIGTSDVNTAEYSVTKINEDLSQPYDDFFIKTQSILKNTSTYFGETQLIKQSDLSIGFLRGALNSASIAHDYSNGIQRGQYETCGDFTKKWK